MPHHTAPRRVPASLRCAGDEAPGLTCTLQAVTASPAALATFTAALMSRSSRVPHAGHVHSRTCRGLGPSLIPHAEQVREVGSNRPILMKIRPCSRALYSSMPTNPGPSGVMDGLGQPGPGQAVDRQVLDGERLVVADQGRGELVVKVSPRVGRYRVRSER